MGYRYYDSAQRPVLFPFGYGLSYTSFAYSDLALSAPSMADTDELTVTFTVTNTGKVAGAETTQLYVKAPASKLFKAEKELKGFTKGFLAPGESKTASITLNSRAFAYYNTNIHDWHVENGRYIIALGASSRDIRLLAAVDVTSSKEAIEVPDYRAVAPHYYRLKDEALDIFKKKISPRFVADPCPPTSEKSTSPLPSTPPSETLYKSPLAGRFIIKRPRAWPQPSGPRKIPMIPW